MEALHAHPDNFKCYIQNRLGFIRLALETGARPIPCLGFGENKAFWTYYPGHDDELTSSRFFALQQRLCKVFSFSFPIITWPIPRQKPIDVVVGAPVIFTSQNVEKCHEQYIDGVRKLYNEHKDKYGYENIDIEFL